MHCRRLVLVVALACATLAYEAPIAQAREWEGAPAIPSALIPACPLPRTFKQMSSDETSGCRGNPGTCHGQCNDPDDFCRTLVGSNGKRVCGCSTTPP
jgi:hypothetical protein